MAVLKAMPLPRTLIALLAPLVAFVLELLLWELIKPQIWVLFYPAVFVSAAIGGRRLGLIATALSTCLVWWYFLPPVYSLSHRAPESLRDRGLLLDRRCVYLFPRAPGQSDQS